MLSLLVVMSVSSISLKIARYMVIASSVIKAAGRHHMYVLLPTKNNKTLVLRQSRTIRNGCVTAYIPGQSTAGDSKPQTILKIDCCIGSSSSGYGSGCTLFLKD